MLIYYLIGVIVSLYFIYYYRISNKTKSEPKQTDALLTLFAPWIFPLQIIKHLFFDKFNVEYTIEYFEQKYGVIVTIYPIFKLGKCNYDSFIKIGYHYNIIKPNCSDNKCYHIDCSFLEIFPERLLEENDTFKEICYDIFDSKAEAEKDAINKLKEFYNYS